MATRTSIELHPDGCRVAEVVVPHDAAGGAIVRAFSTSVADGRDASTLTESLARLRRSQRLPRRAWVIVWGVGPRPLRPARALVDDVRDHLQPIVSAGFVVEGVSTPSHALAALARSRREATPDAVVAYIDIEARASCLALVRDGALLIGRELPRGHAGSTDALHGDIAAALRQSLETLQTPRDIESAVVCGDDECLPELARRLGATLGIPLEAVGWADGVDLAASPALAHASPSEVAALRLAVAAAMASGPADTLVPADTRRPRDRRTRLRIAAVIIALLVAAGWYVVHAAAGGVDHGDIAGSSESAATRRALP